MVEERIKINDFKKLDLRVGKIAGVEEHPNAFKLFILKVDFGKEIGERTIVAGLRSYYKKEELEGKEAVFVVNLEPVVLRGVKSDGMILAVNSGNGYAILIPEKDVNVGSKVR